jgi:integrase
LPADKAQIDYWDQVLKGLGLRIGAKGTRTFNVQVRVLSEGRWRDIRMKLGTYPAMTLAEARRKAGEAQRRAAAGDDPRQQRIVERHQLEETSRNSFASCREDFLRRYGKKRLKANTLTEYRRTLEGDDFKDWESRPVSSITQLNVLHMLDGIADRGAESMANRTLSYLRKMMNWLVDRGVLENSPCDRVKAPAKEITRDRILTDDELGAVWSAFEIRGGAFEGPFKLMMLLGQRESEIVGMRWSELNGLDGAEPLWTIPKSRVKMDREHLVPLPPKAVDIIHAHQPENGGLMFTTNGIRPISGFSKAKIRIDQESGVFDWRLHDLRRTLRSGLARLGISSEVARKVVNHKLAGIDAVYDRYQYLNERRAALAAWANLLEVIINGEDRDNVEDLMRARGERA